MVSGEGEASDVSPRGLRIESDTAVEAGSEMTMVVDAGGEENLEAVGKVNWCKERSSPTGKKVYDIGLSFETNWLAQQRGPLGTALARIFAMNSYEPARTFERTPVSLRASAAGEEQEGLEIADLSLGGMMLRCTEGLGEKVKDGGAVIVELEIDGKTLSVDGKVVWVAGGEAAEEGGLRIADAFGVQFEDVAADDEELIDRIRLGKSTPERITVFLQH
jgi:Tfp pilus assembly protein PilZ